MLLLIRNRLDLYNSKDHVMMLLVQMLISNLTDVRNQQLLNCEHIDVTCTALVDHVTQVCHTPYLYCQTNYTHIKITSKANECLALEARQFAEQKATLLDEVNNSIPQSIITRYTLYRCLLY